MKAPICALLFFLAATSVLVACSGPSVPPVVEPPVQPTMPSVDTPGDVPQEASALSEVTDASASDNPEDVVPTDPAPETPDDGRAEGTALSVEPAPLAPAATAQATP